MIDTGLKNKIVLISGVNNPHGIGAATAKAFAAEGATIFVTYLRLPAIESMTNVPGEAFFRAQNAKTADEVITAIRERGGTIEAWEADLADPAVIPHLFDRMEQVFGPVDILINNAAHCDPDTFIPQSQLGSNSRAVDEFPMSTITADKHDQHFAVNSRAVALMMAEFARRHVERGARWGRIINVSTDGASAFSRAVSYGASKHAVVGIAGALRAELAGTGVGVSVGVAVGVSIGVAVFAGAGVNVGVAVGGIVGVSVGV